MPTVVSSGTTVTDGTEQTLATPILNRTYVMWFDLVLLQAADTVRVRFKRKVLSSGTERECGYQDFSGVQDPPVQCLVPVSFPYGGSFTLQRTGGTDRSIPWSLESL